MNNRFYKKMYGITVKGEFHPDMDGVQVTLDYHDKNFEVFPVLNQFLTENSRTYPFSYIPLHKTEPVVRGQFIFDRNREGQMRLIMELTAPVIEKVTFVPGYIHSDDPVKPLPPEPEAPPLLPAGTRESIVVKASGQAYRDLFPYLFIRPWPRISDYDRATRFLYYNADSKANDQQKKFYHTLITLKQQGNRVKMETEAIGFIEGTGAYKGQFIFMGSPFKTIIPSFLSIYRTLQQASVINLETLDESVKHARIGDWEKIKKELQSQDYQNEKERIWQSYFAMVIIPGYDIRLYEDLVKILIIANLVETRAMESFPFPFDLERDSKKEVPIDKQKTVTEFTNDNETTVAPAPDDSSNSSLALGNEPASWICRKKKIIDEDVYRMAMATIVLPVTVFPLPPAENHVLSSPPRCISPGQWMEQLLPSSPPRSPICKQWVMPYAVGELQMVRYRLDGYRLGEISNIENILRGESKEVHRRRLERKQDQDNRDQQQGTQNSSTTSDKTDDFLDEIKKTLKSKTTKTSYTGEGSQKDTIGGWTITEDPAGGGSDKITKFARDVVNRTVNRIDKKVNQTRSLTVLEETEEIKIQRFDNTGGQANILGIYRWVNKFYSLIVEDYGTALILEMMINQPASEYIKNRQRQYPIDLTPPISPEKIGLTNFSLISTEPETSKGTPNPFYYLKLMEAYGIGEESGITPPPLSTTVSLVLQTPKSSATVEADIPEGYIAETASVALAFETSGTSAQILIASQKKSYSSSGKSSPPASSNKSGGQLEFDLKLETSKIPICIITTPPVSKSGNGSGQSNSGSEENTGSSSKSGSSGDKSNDSTPPDAGCVANVEIRCVPNQEIINRWKYNTYLEILKGYKKKLAEYYKKQIEQKAGLQSANPQVNQDIVWQQLKKKCIEFLRELYVQMVVGLEKESDMETPEEVVDKPRYVQFFEHSLQWDKMTYSLIPADDDTADSYDLTGEEFENFLKAEKARILLPVDQTLTRSFLFFLTSGMIWPTQGKWVPVAELESAICIINDLERCDKKEERTELKKPIKESWHVAIPTAMKVLQKGDSFPNVEEENRHLLNQDRLLD